LVPNETCFSFSNLGQQKSNQVNSKASFLLKQTIFNQILPIEPPHLFFAKFKTNCKLYDDDCYELGRVSFGQGKSLPTIAESFLRLITSQRLTRIQQRFDFNNLLI